jgi:hypothetical protein
MQAFLNESLPDFKAAVRAAANASASPPIAPMQRTIPACAVPSASESNNTETHHSSSDLLKTSTPSADPILSSLNQQNFPKQFSKASTQNPAASNMTRLLEAVREGRSHHDPVLEHQQKLDQEILRGREIARLEAFKKGLRAPGADVLLWRNEPRPRPVRLGFKKAAIAIHGDKGIPFIPPKLKEPPRQILTVADKSEVVERGTMHRRRARYVFETLNDALAAKSEELLASHLAMPLPSTETGTGFYHPRHLLSNSKTKEAVKGGSRR